MFSDDFIEKMTANGSIIGYAGDFHFPSGSLHNHTGVGEVVINGTTYFGVGELGNIGPIENVSDANPATVEVSLIGIPSTIFNQVMQSNIRGSSVTIYKVVYAANGKVLAAEAAIVGQVTDASWELKEEGAFTISVADEFVLYERPLQKYYTNSSWQKDHPNDKFWQYVAPLSNTTIYWGKSKDADTTS